MTVFESHPYIAVDMNRCIDCYRCVRICDELQGQFVWHVRDRGLDTRVEPDGPNLLESSCVSCGACVDTCPTGALEDATASTLKPASAWTRTTCPYCGVGCELSVGTRDDAIVAVAPVMDAPVSKGHLCVKGRYAFGFVNADDRVTEPMIRDGAGWRRTSWSEARAFVVERLRTLIDRYGPDSIGVLGSARATNEDNFLTQKLARTVIGTNNVDCCARVCHTPSGVALKHMLGAGLGTNSFDDIESRANDPRRRRQSDRGPSDRRRAHQAGGPPRRAADRRGSTPHRADRIRRLSSGAPARHQHPAVECDRPHDRHRRAVRSGFPGEPR